MKVTISFYIWAFCLSAALCAPVQEEDTKEEDALRALTKLYEIDIQTKPEDGTVKGIRIRRNEGTEGASSPEELLLPEIDIQNLNDQTLSINGIRLKRSDLSSLSDVELEKDVEAEASELQEGETDERTRRSEESLLSILASGITKKLHKLAAASSGHDSETNLSYPAPNLSYDDKSFNFWTFKKAILNTLLQAVKAIKGGVIALGGQLVKAKGHLIATAGKVVVHKGEAINSFGRQVAAKALLTPPAHISAPATAFASAAIDHVPDTGYPAAGYPQASYGAPIAPNNYNTLSNTYGAPDHGYAKRGAPNNQYGVPHELPHGVQAGLLVLKPINAGDQSAQYAKPLGAQGFAARDSASSPSQNQPLIVQNNQEAQSRSYFVQY